MVLEKDGEHSCADRLRNEEVLGVKEERNVLQTIKGRKANWIGSVLCRNCLLKHVIEGNIEVAGRRGRRRKQLLDDCKKKKGCSKLKEKH